MYSVKILCLSEAAAKMSKPCSNGDKLGDRAGLQDDPYCSAAKLLYCPRPMGSRVVILQYDVVMLSERQDNWL